MSMMYLDDMAPVLPSRKRMGTEHQRPWRVVRYHLEVKYHLHQISARDAAAQQHKKRKSPIEYFEAYRQQEQQQLLSSVVYLNDADAVCPGDRLVLVRRPSLWYCNFLPHVPWDFYDPEAVHGSEEAAMEAVMLRRSAISGSIFGLGDWADVPMRAKYHPSAVRQGRLPRPNAAAVSNNYVCSKCGMYPSDHYACFCPNPHHHHFFLSTLSSSSTAASAGVPPDPENYPGRFLSQVPAGIPKTFYERLGNDVTTYARAIEIAVARKVAPLMVYTDGHSYYIAAAAAAAASAAESVAEDDDDIIVPTVPATYSVGWFANELKRGAFSLASSTSNKEGKKKPSFYVVLTKAAAEQPQQPSPLVSHIFRENRLLTGKVAWSTQAALWFSNVIEEEEATAASISSSSSDAAATAAMLLLVLTQLEWALYKIYLKRTTNSNVGSEGYPHQHQQQQQLAVMPL